MLGSFIKNHRVFALQISISAVLCFSLLALFPVKTSKFIAEDISSWGNSLDYEIFFIDFDADSSSERVELSFNKNNNESHAVFFDSDGTIIDQWNFSERWLSKFSSAGDYNNDGNQEFYVFTRNEDSLFFYIIDPLLKPHFRKKRLFIAKAEDRRLNPSGQWDVYSNGFLFVDLDEDGYKELVISVHSGLSQFPRSVIAYNFNKEQIIAATPRWGINLGYPQFVQQANADTLIYFRLSIGSFNIHDRSQYRDDKTWFVILDKNLKPLFEPIPFGKEFSGLTSFSSFNGDSLLFTLISAEHGTEVKKSSLYTLSPQGEILRGKPLPVTTNYNLFQIPEFYSDTNFLCTDDSLFILKSDLSTEFFRSVPVLLDYVSSAPILSDSGKEILFFDLYNYWVSDSSLSNFTKIDQHFDRSRYIVHPVSGMSNGANLVIETSDKLYFMQYKPNPWYPYRYLYPAGLFAACFGFVFTGYLYIKQRIFFHHFSDQLFLNAQRGIILLDHSGRVSKVNSAAGELLKIESAVKPGGKFIERFSDFPVLKEVFSAMAIQQKNIVREMTLQHKDETLRLQINGYPLHKEHNEPVGFLIEILDYTDPIHKERMNMWSDTVKRFAHDLKTPLSSLFLMADNLSQKISEYPPEIRPQMQEDLKIFTGEIQRLKKMTKRFAQFSEFQNMKFAKVRIADIVQNALDELYSLITPEISVTNQIIDPAVEILGDEVQLQRVLHILIKNSIEALSGSGQILLRASLAQNLKSDHSDTCTIEVCDTGSGISSEYKNKLFEPFFTTKADGSGLGLSIAKKIVLEHHGQIYITGDAKYATIIRVVLPTGNNGSANV